MTSPTESPPGQPPRARGLTGALESREPHRRSLKEYKSFIRKHYDGFAGALTAVTGVLTGHEALAGRLIRPGAFDVRGCKRILATRALQIDSHKSVISLHYSYTCPSEGRATIK